MGDTVAFPCSQGGGNSAVCGRIHGQLTVLSQMGWPQKDWCFLPYVGSAMKAEGRGLPALGSRGQGAQPTPAHLSGFGKVSGGLGEQVSAGTDAGGFPLSQEEKFLLFLLLACVFLSLTSSLMSALNLCDQQWVCS